MSLIPSTINSLLDNIGTNLSVLIEIIVICLALLMGAINFVRAIIVLFIGNVLLFIWFFKAGLLWTLPLALFLISFVLMALLLFVIMRATQQQGGFA